MPKANKWKQKAKKAQAELNQLRKKHEKCLAILKQVKQQSLHDELTLLPNRRYFNQYLKQQWTTCERANLSLGLLLCDIDNFKVYNDHYGHQKGDDCLRIVAQALNNVIRRKNDFVARFGGEEFAVILPDTQINGVRKVGINMVRAIAGLRIANPESNNLWVTLSVGGNVIVPNKKESIEHLIKTADSTLYFAKESGKNQSMLYQDTSIHTTLQDLAFIHHN